MQTINGLKVDGDAIGAGLYKIICEKGEDHIVAFGMIPLWAIELLRKPLRDKIIAEAANTIRCTVAEVSPYLDEEAITRTMRDIEHVIVLGIYSAASKAGMMRVSASPLPHQYWLLHPFSRAGVATNKEDEYAYQAIKTNWLYRLRCRSEYPQMAGSS